VGPNPPEPRDLCQRSSGPSSVGGRMLSRMMQTLSTKLQRPSRWDKEAYRGAVLVIPDAFALVLFARQQ
jgi:hypothetical protein